MEFTQEFIEANGLEENQVKALTNYIETEVKPIIKKEYDGVANKNAEGILDGASRMVKERLGIDLEREQGEKYADYLSRVSETHFSSKNAELSLKKKEYEDKLKNFKGGEEYKEELDKLKVEKDNLLKQVAELEPLKGIDEKYKETTQRLTSMQKEVAYTNVKPRFPEGVNKYEAEAKWNEFKSGAESSYNIELIDGKPFAIDKENEHKKYPLEDLVSKDQNITELLKGRQQGGTNAKPADLLAVEGLPFKIPKGATPTEITNIVREYVVSQVGDITSPGYAKMFSEVYQKVKNAKN